MKRQNHKLTVLYIALAALLTFIWGNSLLPVKVSAAESASIGSFLLPALELFVGKGNVTDHLVRKLAHFCEFGALGVLLGLILRTRHREDAFNISYVTFFGVSAAVIDESIQLFAEGRGAQVQDVLLDSCGMLAGLVGISLVCILVNKIQNHHAKGTEKNERSSDRRHRLYRLPHRR